MKKSLKELQALVASLHAQPRLSDSLPDGARLVWDYSGGEAALLLIRSPGATPEKVNKTHR